MRKTNKTITYEQLIKRNKQFNQLEKQGFIIIRKEHNKILGYTFLVLGVLPIPFTTPLFIGLGLFFLGLSIDKIRERLRHKIFMIKYKRGLK